MAKYIVMKEKLKYLYGLNSQVKRSTEDLVDLKITNSLKGNKTCKIEKKEMELKTKVEECKKLEQEVVGFLNTIDDPFVRQVLHYRYVKCMSWQKVAYMTGGYNTADGVRKMTERFLKSKVSKC